MNYASKVQIINKMEEVYDIEFTEEQIDVLLGDLSVEIERQKGKTFVIACKAILESIVATEPIDIKICVKTKNDLKNMIDYIRVLSNKINIKYTCKKDVITILNGTISIIEVKNSVPHGFLNYEYVLIDDIKDISIFTMDIIHNAIKIEVINKDGSK